MKEVELLGCPFCGTVPFIQHNVSGYDKPQYYVNCINEKDCPVADVRSGWFDSEEEAANAWNTRYE